ncbi:MAG: hypothetical protein BWY78_00438 [Alphaproteobacteria bacterium ADurb.Bin438]|nr:MAG: hypothetical protein BWY78_00438 [Alphaproteobacteria bacterium ADurb.Bin438]
MIVSNPHNAGKIEVTANYSTSSPAQNGPGLLATNRRDLNTVKLHTNATGNTSNSAGGSLILSNTVGGTQTRAELLTSSNQEGTGNGGTLAMYSGTSRNILASAKGPNASGWMSVSRGSSRGVDIFGDYNGRGAGVILTNGENSNNTGLATSVSKVEMLAGGQYNASTFNSPVVTVRGSDRDSNVSIYGNINQSNSVLAAASRKGGGISFRDTAGNEDTFLVGNNNTPNGAGGWARIGNNGSQGVDIYADHSGQGAKMYVGGGVNFHSSFNGNNNPSMITASDLRASAKVKVGGGSGAAGSVSANTVKTLVLSANSFNNKGGGYIGNFLFEHIRPHMGSYASAPTKIGHWRCIVSEKNCPIYNNQGEIIDYVGAESYATWGKHSDVFAGRVHDYSLYAYGEITVDGFNYSHTNDARHFGEYDVWSRPRHTVLSGNRLQTQKGVMEGPFSDSQKHSYMTQWHDNLSGRNDDGPWSKWQANELFPGQTYSDQVPSTWNGQDPNY